MAVDKKFIFNLAPELESEDSKRINFFIDQAKLQISESAYGGCYDLAVGLMTAHMMILNNKSGGTVGEVVSEKVGDLQTNYASSTSGNMSYLSKTPYGSQLEELRKSLPTSPRVLGCG